MYHTCTSHILTDNFACCHVGCCKLCCYGAKWADIRQVRFGHSMSNIQLGMSFICISFHKASKLYLINSIVQECGVIIGVSDPMNIISWFIWNPSSDKLYSTSTYYTYRVLMMSENILQRQSPFFCSALQELLPVHSFFRLQFLCKYLCSVHSNIVECKLEKVQ